MGNCPGLEKKEHIVSPKLPERIVLAAMFTLLVQLPLMSAPPKNMLANPGFEDPPATPNDVSNAAVGWAAFGDPYTRWVTRQFAPHDGSQCLKLFGPWNQWGGTGMTQTFPAAPGQTWIGEIWSMNANGDPMQPGNFCVIKVLFLSSDGVNPPGGEWLAGVNVYEQKVADSTSPKDVWQMFGVGTAPAPDGTAFVQFLLVEVQGNNPPLGGSVFLDDAVLRMQPMDPCELHDPVFDINDDQRVDSQDFDVFLSCLTGPAIPLAADAPQVCKCMDRDGDNDVDQADFGAFQRCYTGPLGTVDPNCDNP